MLPCCADHVPQGAQLIELLRKNPAVAIPVIIIRLEQKEAEWLKVGLLSGWELLGWANAAA